MISKEECIKYQKDIDRMYRNRRIFLSIGLPLLLSFVVLIPLAIIYYKNGAFSDAMITLSVIFFIIGLVLQ